MRDLDIRKVLRQRLSDRYGGQHDTLIVDELGVCQGTVRIDMAVVNGALHGFEIKSERDTLCRLPQQQETYSKVFDTVTIVIGPSYLEAVQAQVPEWWGIMEAQPRKNGEPRLKERRKPKRNPDVKADCLVQLLWKEEVLDLLSEQGLAKGLRSKPRRVLWRVLAEETPLDSLRDLVRQKLVSRTNWRSDASQEPSGEMSPLCAM